MNLPKSLSPCTLIGASVRSFAEAVLLEGGQPICFDMFADADLGKRLQEAGLPLQKHLKQIDEFAQQPNVTGTTIRLGGAEIVAHAERLKPENLYPALQQRGIPVLPWRLQLKDSDTPGEWLGKNSSEAGGTHIQLGKPASGPSAGRYFQRFESGPVVSLTCCGDRILGSCLQLSGCPELNAPKWFHCGNVGPLILPKELRQQAEDLVRALQDHSPIDGVFGLDVVLSDGTLFLIDVNARPTASHELIDWNSDGPTVLQAHLGTALASNTEQRQQPLERFARFILYAAKSTTVDTQWMLRQTRSLQPVPSEQAWLADVPVEGSKISPGEPVCSVYVRLDKPAAMQQARGLARGLPSAGLAFSAEFIHRIQDQIHIVEAYF